jgi:hypothetical protein
MASEQSGGATGAVGSLMRSLRAYLEGNWEECPSAIAAVETGITGDPEVLFYAARNLARISQTERAIAALFKATDRGFVCVSALSRDPWFDMELG